MKALVTGASGFVGSAVARRLIEAGHEVRVIVRPTSDRRNVAELDCEIVVGDLTDDAAVKSAVAGCDALFHIAADYRLWVPDPAVIYRANVDATRGLIRAAGEAGVDRIVYCSSVAAIGTTPTGVPADETRAAVLDEMIGHYKRSKFLAEQEVRRLVAEEKLPIVIVNPSAPFGPRDVKPTPTGRIVVEAALGKMPAYVATGLNVVHVADVAEGHLLAYEKGKIGERYILGGENMTLLEILIALADITGGRPPRFRVPRGALVPAAWISELIARGSRREPRLTRDSAHMAGRYMFYSNEKARRELGFIARPAKDALRDAYDWFRANGYLG
jgi:dihydroflavonol-4-reductase